MFNKQVQIILFCGIFLLITSCTLSHSSRKRTYFSQSQKLKSGNTVQVSVHTKSSELIYHSLCVHTLKASLNYSDNKSIIAKKILIEDKHCDHKTDSGVISFYYPHKTVTRQLTYKEQKKFNTVFKNYSIHKSTELISPILETILLEIKY